MDEAESNGRAVLRLDIGKSSHWARLISGGGKALADRPADDLEAELDERITTALGDDIAHTCPLTTPRIGPRAAAEFVVGADVADLQTTAILPHNYGVAPKDQ